ncbi:hypothetical protein C8R42DRAFT_718584 [Lentinula raphanica]|nr:hypothetical protein C8R42DRAFT_718584 [Lentinula raphanica]
MRTWVGTRSLEKLASVNQYVDEGTDKNVLRGLLKDVLLMSLRQVRLNKEFKKMKWGSAFADLCFKEKIKLINYPAGMKPIGPKVGYTGAAFIHVHHLKFIVKRYIWFWQQEAKAKKAEATRPRDASALFDDGDDNDEDETSNEQKIFIRKNILISRVPRDTPQFLGSLREPRVSEFFEASKNSLGAFWCFLGLSDAFRIFQDL